MNLEKPVNLKEDVWQFLLKGIGDISKNNLRDTLVKLGYRLGKEESFKIMLKKVSEEPAAFLLYIGLLEHPDLMKNMILGIITDKELDIELEYIFTERAVEDLSQGKEFIVLDMLGGPEKDIAITKEGLAENLRRNCIIDYLEEKQLL